MVDEKIGPFDLLSKAWYNLRLSVRCPARVPTWDAIILTAASPEQAELYQWHLDRAKQQGRIEASTIVLAVPDPQGRRIGSGGATLSALRSLAHHLVSNRSEANASSPFSEHPSGGASIHLKLLKMSILLIHAGGDSKRVPWANPIGKAFLPLPFLAEDDPDGPVPSLFDHILAISSSAVQNFKFAGGLLIMTGDVLPCFDFSDIHLPENGACVVVVPTSLDIAANHGVIVASSVDGKGDLCHGISHLGQRHLKLEIVVDLLQKPSQQALVDRGALRSKDTALLDTGIFVIRGEAWRDLSSLAVEDPNPVMELLNSAQELSLYEELAGAWVPARHGWLKTRPLGKKLIGALGSQPLFCYCARRGAVIFSLWNLS